MQNDNGILSLPGVTLIDKYKTLVIGKKSQTYQVYRVPLKYLYYNDQNDRISTEIERYRSEGKDIDINDREAYNKIFEELIYKTRPDLLKKTQKSISNRGQDNPGVTLSDGRVVDGNRRFTCLRRIQEETHEEQYFETVILSYDYEHQYKLIKSLELELQMGVEEKVDYDPIDRLYGVYKSIRVEHAFTVEEYAALFDDKSIKDVKKDLELADLMCEYLKFINCPNQFHLAKDMKLDGVLEEMPAILKNVRDSDPDLEDDVKLIIFTAITTGVSSRLNLYVRNEIGKLVKNKADLEELVDNTREAVDDLRIVIDSKETVTAEDINEIHAMEDIVQKFNSPISAQNEKVNNRSIQDAPLKMVRDANSKLNSIVVSSIPSMRDEDKARLGNELEALSKKIEELRSSLEP